MISRIKSRDRCLGIYKQTLYLYRKEQITVPGSPPPPTTLFLSLLSFASVFENSVLLLVFNETSMFIIFDSRLGCLQFKAMLFCPHTDSTGSLRRFLCTKMTPGHQSSSGKKQILHLSNSASKIKYCQLSFLFLRGEKKNRKDKILIWTRKHASIL